MSYESTAVTQTISLSESNDRSPLQPDVILPEQFFATLRAEVTGERLLVIAVLEDAIECFQKFLLATRRRNRRLFRDAEQWIMETERRVSDGDTLPYLSFEYVCDALRLDPDEVRERLKRWRQRELESARPPASAALQRRVGAEEADGWRLSRGQACPSERAGHPPAP